VASKKQRRRRQKERRHEYEYVYVDSEGQEVAVEGDESPRPADGKTPPAPKPLTTERGRKIEPPSWRRTLRRAALFAPLMLVILYLLRPKDGSSAGVVVNVLVLMAFFVPFSYFMDSLMYRFAQKRLARGGGSSPKSSSR
jgi:hypothetical protein